MNAVEAEVERVIPAVLPYDFYDTSIDVTKAQNAIKPEAIALGVFGLIAALAALLIAGQVIGRQLSFWAHEERTLRALGADPAMTAGDGLLGMMGAIVLGALLAGLVAVALSPLAPLGPVRPFDPDRGINLDWTVLGLGMLMLVVVLGFVAVVLVVQRAPHRVRRLGQPPAGSVSCRRGRGVGGPARLGRHRYPLRPRAGRGGGFGPGALRHSRCHVDRRRRHRHRRVRCEPQLARVTPAPLRLELELRRARRRWGR